MATDIIATVRSPLLLKKSLDQVKMTIPIGKGNSILNRHGRDPNVIIGNRRALLRQASPESAVVDGRLPVRPQDLRQGGKFFYRAQGHIATSRLPESSCVQLPQNNHGKKQQGRGLESFGNL